jgi:hypothetical protein
MRLFKELKPSIIAHIEKCLKDNDYSSIQSLLINRRKPHTERLFFYLGDERICFHTFQPASSEECFAHPHSWESEIVLLEGEYEHYIKTDVPLTSNENENWKYVKHLLRPGSSYHIDDPGTWHKVVPLVECKTLMINGPIWDNYNINCKFTKGKELVSLEESKIVKILSYYHHHLSSDKWKNF